MPREEDEMQPGIDPYYMQPGVKGSIEDNIGEHFLGYLHDGEDQSCESRYGLGYQGVDGFPYNGINYPFMIPTFASLFLEDLHVSWQREPLTELHLISITGVGELDSGLVIPTSEHEIDLQLGDEDGTVLLDTVGMQLRTRIWCNNVKVHLWQNADVVIQAVVRHGDATYDRYEFEQLPLDPRAIEFRPVSLRDLVVSQNDQFVSLLRENMAVKVRPGFNSSFFVSSIKSSRGERISRFELDAVPGAGLGKFGECDAGLGINAIGRVSASPEGDILIGGLDCISFRPQLTYGSATATVQDGRFELYDSCTAPCDCGDFASVANYAVGLWNQYRILASRIDNIRDRYHSVREQILNWKSCVESNPLRLQIWRSGACAIGVGAGICNVSDQCLTDLSIVVTVQDENEQSIGEVNSNYVYQTQYLGGMAYNAKTNYSTTAEGALVVPLNDIEPGQMGFVFFRYELGEGNCDAGQLQFSLQGNLPDSWSELASLTKTFNYA